MAETKQCKGKEKFLQPELCVFSLSERKLSMGKAPHQEKWRVLDGHCAQHGKAQKARNLHPGKQNRNHNKPGMLYPVISNRLQQAAAITQWPRTQMTKL